MISAQKKYIYWFKELTKEEIPIAGGKGANLGELTAAGFPVPNGFVVSSNAYFDFLDHNQLRSRIVREMHNISLSDPQSFSDASSKVKRLILSAEMPKEIASQIMTNYLKLGSAFSKQKVAVRSSATAEDLPTASFAGQQVTYLDVQGEANVVRRVHDCWASLFEPRAIFYREENKFDHFKVGIAVPVQIMIPSDVSGVMFTIDPISNEKNKIVIEAVYGLGEYMVQGVVSPDHYVVEKNSLEILQKTISSQKVQLIRAIIETKEASVPARLQNKRKLTDNQIIEVAKLGCKAHQHYFFPQDIEWAIYKNQVYILQSRPITTINKKNENLKEEIKIDRKPILIGVPASPGIASGPTKKIMTPKEINKINNGEVLVTSMTTPDFVPAMKKAVAIITDKGGQTSHAAIVSRELGIPCVVGTTKATKMFNSGKIVTVNGSKGEIYEGGIIQDPKNKTVQFEKMQEENHTKIRTATKVYVNLGEPQLADSMAGRDVDGVGLLRAEFMIAEVGVHPKKLIHDKKSNIFVDKMTEGIETFCKAFGDRPVVYRATDFKTNEYRNLEGGKAFEPEEANPLIGYRGAFRYISDEAVFELELKAIKKVRETYKNLWLMIPFVRTPQELAQVKKIITANGIIRSSSFKLWLMVEIPANVILLEDFIAVGIDGVSIGSNDLTMLTLGVDRDNQELAKIFDERNPAVTQLIERTIKTCVKNKITVSLCGQAASTWGELVEKMVEWGITSVSVNPDAIENTRQLIYQTEAALIGKK